MPSSMQPGKRYRMRQDGGQRFVDGYFLDQRFYDGPDAHVGNVEPDGSFRFLPSHWQNVPVHLHELAGNVDGLRIVRQDGTGFDLVEVAENT